MAATGDPSITEMVLLYRANPAALTTHRVTVRSLLRKRISKDRWNGLITNQFCTLIIIKRTEIRLSRKSVTETA